MSANFPTVVLPRIEAGGRRPRRRRRTRATERISRLLARAFASGKRPVARYAGLLLIIGCAAGLTVGYLGYADAKTRAATPDVSYRTQNVAAPSRPGKTSASAVPPAPRKVLITTVRKPRLEPWKRLMTYSAAGLTLGAAAVGLSLHERRPKPRISGADEMLNDRPPF